MVSDKQKNTLQVYSIFLPNYCDENKKEATNESGHRALLFTFKGMCSSYAPPIPLLVKCIHAQTLALVLVSDNLASIWHNNNDFILFSGCLFPLKCLLFPQECFCFTNWTAIWTLTLPLICAVTGWLSVLAECLIYLLIGNKPFVSFLFYDFFISLLLCFAELVLAIDPQCGNAGTTRWL